MKKLLFTLLFVLFSTYVQANIVGLSIHYEPTSGEFVKGCNNWIFISDYASVGLYTKMVLLDKTYTTGDTNEIFLLINDRLIFGSDIYQTSIFITGNVLSATLSMNNFIVLNYKFYSFWDRGNSNPLYMMQTGQSHMVSVDINFPIFSF